MPEQHESVAQHNEEAPETQQTPAVDRAIFEVYGKSGLEYFNTLYKERPEWTLEEVVKHFEAHPVSEQTKFFRTNNLTTIARELVPRLESLERGQPIKILEIGSSSGEESYSLATRMLEAGHADFQITAADVNPDMVKTATTGEYKLWKPIASVDTGSSGLQKEHFADGYFEDSGKTWKQKTYIGPPIGQLIHDPQYVDQQTKRLIDRKRLPEEWYTSDDLPIIQPTQKVKDHIRFTVHDLINSPVDGKFSIALMNNVLLHYPEKTREQMLRNALASLKPGGFLVLEHQMVPINDAEQEWLDPYNRWRNGFPVKFGLEKAALDWKGTKYLSNECYQFIDPEAAGTASMH